MTQGSTVVHCNLCFYKLHKVNRSLLTLLVYQFYVLPLPLSWSDLVINGFELFISEKSLYLVFQLKILYTRAAVVRTDMYTLFFYPPPLL